MLCNDASGCGVRSRWAAGSEVAVVLSFFSGGGVGVMGLDCPQPFRWSPANWDSNRGVPRRADFCDGRIVVDSVCCVMASTVVWFGVCEPWFRNQSVSETSYN